MAASPAPSGADASEGAGMAKIRLHGTPSEVKELADMLGRWDALRVSNVSKPYRDRGESGRVRVYIEAEPAPKPKEARNAHRD